MYAVTKECKISEKNYWEIDRAILKCQRYESRQNELSHSGFMFFYLIRKSIFGICEYIEY